MHFKYGFGIYLIVLAIAVLLIMVAIIILRKNIRQFNYCWIISFCLVVIAFVGTIYFKSPCLDDVWHTYAIENESIVKIIDSETFNPNTAKDRLLKEKDIIHEAALDDDRYIRSIKWAPERSYIEIFIMKCESIDIAKRIFNRNKYEYNDYGIMAEGNLKRGEYYATYMIQYRADPEGWRMLTDEYTKLIYIRKGNLLIEITEDSRAGITEINDWVKILTEV